MDSYFILVIVMLFPFHISIYDIGVVASNEDSLYLSITALLHVLTKYY